VLCKENSKSQLSRQSQSILDGKFHFIDMPLASLDRIVVLSQVSFADQVPRSESQ